MIHESGPWKRELLRDADLIERWSKKLESDRRSTLLEKKIFHSAFSIRKIIEARRISSSLSGRSVDTVLFPISDSNPNRLNNHRFDRQYDLDAGVRTNIAASKLIDLVIHSYTFVECLSEAGQFEAFFITSDRTRAVGLYEISIASYVELMRVVGNDDPEMTTYRYNESQGDYDVWKGPDPQRRT